MYCIFYKNISSDNNKKCFLRMHIRMISEESCDTEDWSNDAESSALITARINYILKHIEKENSYFFISVMSNSFFTILLFYWILNQIMQPW